jgi:hypothetical protein
MSKKHKQVKKVRFSAVSLILISLLLAACSSASPTPPPTNTPAPTPTVPPKEIPFSPFEQDLALAEGAYERFQQESTKLGKAVKYLPTVAVAPADFSWFNSANLPQPLKIIDWRQEIALLIYMQGGSRSQFSIQIREISQNGDKIKVICDVRQPSGDVLTITIVNYLFSGGYIKRASLQPQGDLTFSFVDQNGTLLGEVRARV